ncbi:hypothetical protein ASPWEDRAFT_42102 [Aspergillus wentii DTO 134E9]|uniref:Uncharacterized protein n=1 Tax=Aspergillus wentii DTO 134E9 TaxID=1073089 RepID=A0A1L9RGX4_ASPWE|nr:uncharacterized protein ASPWEDRAFT_42102 [Aspergillus wentii DTO 134E9]OJJ34180.1 hypothetical protein ASPWEDRAFT_42102 [Aspergillus wentii DTO 134E9]
MQPPSPHPTFFFLYDLVRNTYKQLKDIDVEKHTSGDKAARDQVSEVYGRNNFANILVNDTTGKLALLTGGDPSNPVDFGDDIRSKAKALSDV